MRPLDEHMAFYACYHRDRRNQATHFVGVPAIAFAILIPMAFLSFGQAAGVKVTLAGLFTLWMLIYYVRLDAVLGLTMAALYLPLLWIAHGVAGQGIGIAAAVCAVFFFGGWALQLWGHRFEGRKPALADNLFQLFVAPIFLAAELFFRAGLKRDLLEKVEARIATGDFKGADRALAHLRPAAVVPAA